MTKIEMPRWYWLWAGTLTMWAGIYALATEACSASSLSAIGVACIILGSNVVGACLWSRTRR